MKEGELCTRLESLARPRVLIVGDLILDRYIWGTVERISPEAPIPVLAARSTETRLGGAGNVAANLRAMEAEVEILGVAGQDERGETLAGLLEAIGVEHAGVLRLSERPTTEKTRMLGSGAQMLRVDWETTRALSDADAARLVHGVARRVARASAVVLSDYGKGVLCEPVLRAVIEAARAAQVPVLVDPKGTDYARYRGATLLTPNRKEAEEALGRKLPQLSDMPRAVRDLMQAAGVEAAVITLGPDGVYYLFGAEEGHVSTVARAVFDVTGAGDTVIAHLALGLAAGLEFEACVHLANHAAGIVVAKSGAASVTRAELAAVLERGQRGTGSVCTRVELLRRRTEWRAEKKRVVFTNGCFDVLHAGHVAYLREARSHGDVLVVGVNDDASVKRLKGQDRPINALADRMTVLAALEMVDAVVAFAEDTPLEIVQSVTPDVLVKGQDWAEKGVVGREWVERHGGKVVLAKMLPGRSTSAIVERMRAPVATPETRKT
ncbi:MAG: D-glycero-beta-D-manno-heptose-7-phosphate kinase [Planctomycetes bacterium]|nr:D-glycero-beta-D-manno-heptose-7-phosphate kinase [Planctomycetota bacterium]